MSSPSMLWGRYGLVSLVSAGGLGPFASPSAADCMRSRPTVTGVPRSSTSARLLDSTSLTERTQHKTPFTLPFLCRIAEMRILFLFLFLLLDSPCILVFAFWTMLEIERRARADTQTHTGALPVASLTVVRSAVRFGSRAARPCGWVRLRTGHTR